MKDQVYYVVEDDHIQKAEVRESTLSEECLEVKFEGRDYYSPINKTNFLTNASVDRKEALRILVNSLRSRQNFYNEQCSEIDRKISKLYKELITVL